VEVLYEKKGVGAVYLKRLAKNSVLIISLRENDEELRRRCYEIFIKYYPEVLKLLEGRETKKRIRFLMDTVANAPLESYHVVHQDVGPFHIGIGDSYIEFKLPSHIIEGMLRDGIVEVVKEWAERAKT